MDENLYMELGEEGDGLTVSMNAFYQSLMTSFMDVNQLEKEPLFVEIGMIPVGRIDIEKGVQPDQLICRKLYAPFSEDPDREWLLGFLQELLMNPSLPVEMDIDYVCYQDKAYNDYSHFGPEETMDSYKEELLARVRTAYPKAEIDEIGSVFRISLNQDPDDNWPKAVFTDVAEVYKMIDIDNSPYQDFMIKPFKTKLDERVFMDFSKKTGEMEERLLCFDGTVFGGRFEEKKDDFKELLKKDSFFSSFDQDPYRDKVWDFDE